MEINVSKPEEEVLLSNWAYAGAETGVGRGPGPVKYFKFLYF